MAKINMTEIFERTEEVHLNAVVTYLKAADNILYYESDYKTKVKKAELENLFKKGILVVNDGTNLVRPTTYTDATTYAYVAHITVGASNIAVLTKFGSEGYTA